MAAKRVSQKLTVVSSRARFGAVRELCRNTESCEKSGWRHERGSRWPGSQLNGYYVSWGEPGEWNHWYPLLCARLMGTPCRPANHDTYLSTNCLLDVPFAKNTSTASLSNASRKLLPCPQAGKCFSG